MRTLGRLAVLIALAVFALQFYFLSRVALMRVVDPASTSFERSELWRLASQGSALPWRQRWVPFERISPHLARAVIASEDAGFLDHHGIEWDAIERAWRRNRQAEARAERPATARRGKPPATPAVPKVIGGSTITQQLAKNLFLAGERTWPRKAEEAVIASMLEACLDKRRILEIYLNHVEWGEGVFGAEAAARRYFGIGAEALSSQQAARLAVMLPAPKRFEKHPGSPYLASRSATIAARMAAVELP